MVVCVTVCGGRSGRAWRKDSVEGFGERFGGRDLYDDGLVRGFWPPLKWYFLFGPRRFAQKAGLACRV